MPAGFPEDLDPRHLLCFENLTSLGVPYENNTLQILSHIGSKLKELIFKSDYYKTEKESSFDFPTVFVLCPNLENLQYFEFSGDINQQVSLLAENLQLKKLHLKGEFCEASGFLTVVLSAPLLEDVTLEIYDKPKIDINILKSLLARRFVLQNVTKVALFYPDRFLEMTSLSKHIVSFCPKLQTAEFGPRFKWHRDHFNNSLTPFQDLLKMF